VRRFSAPVGQEQPTVVEEHDAIAQQAPALFSVAGNDVSRHAPGIAWGRALRFMAAHDSPASCCEQVAVDRVGTSRGIGPAGFGDRFGHRGFLSVLVAQVNGWW